MPAFHDNLLLNVPVSVKFTLRRTSLAAIACVLNRVRQPKMTVGIDGSTYKYHPFYNFWVTEKLKELIDPSLEVRESL